MKSNLTNEQLIDKVKAWVKKLCETGGSAWTLKVPVDLDNDPDVLIIELCNRFASQSPAQGEGANEIIQPDRNFPLKIWANIYNPIKPDSWDLYFTENSAVRNAIGAKTHCYIHESIMANTKPQPPSGNLWEEVDAVKEPPGERDTVYEDVSVDCMIIFEDGTCKIGYYDYAAKEWRHYTKYNDTVSVGVKSYLRPVTWQRYSEEEMGKAIDLIRDALPYSGYDSLYRKRAEQFIQSLNKK